MYKAPNEATILRNYEDAKEVYASLGLDVEKAIADFDGNFGGVITVFDVILVVDCNYFDLFDLGLFPLS